LLARHRLSRVQRQRRRIAGRRRGCAARQRGRGCRIVGGRRCRRLRRLQGRGRARRRRVVRDGDARVRGLVRRHRRRRGHPVAIALAHTGTSSCKLCMDADATPAGSYLTRSITTPDPGTYTLEAWVLGTAGGPTSWTAEITASPSGPSSTTGPLGVAYSRVQVSASAAAGTTQLRLKIGAASFPRGSCIYVDDVKLTRT